MSNITITENYILPSLGKIYNPQFDPNVTLRSMTVAEEMKRLTVTETPYKVMCDIIDDCLETKLPISVYDMCLGDYQYLLHKLRITTYGPDYKMSIMCSNCGKIFDYTQDLETLSEYIYDESIEKLKLFKLPITNKTIEIGFQTPRDLDNIDKQKKLFKKKFPDLNYDPSIMLNFETIIKSIDGEQLLPQQLQEFIKSLPLKDYKVLAKNAEELNTKVGIDINIIAECPDCGKDVNTSFRYTGEFFRPTTD